MLPDFARNPHLALALMALLVVPAVALPMALGDQLPSVLAPAPASSPAAGTGSPRGTLSAVALADSAEAEAGAPAFAAPVALPDSEGYAEPSIAVAPDGTLYIVAPGTATWRSDDLGLSWSRQADTLGNGGDADVTVDADGVVYASDLLDNAPVSVSFDRGASYEFATDTVGGNNIDRQWVVAMGHGTVFATVDGDAQRFVVSHDQARTFSDPVTMFGNGARPGNLLASSAMDLYIPYDLDGIHLAISHDGGANWDSSDVAVAEGTNCHFPGAARDAAGTLYVVWCAYTSVGFPDPGTARIYLSSSGDDGASWTIPVVLSDDANYNTFPWVVAGDAGRVMVAWYEGVPQVADPLPLRDPGLAVAVDWHVALAWSAEADQASPAFLRTSATGTMHTGPVCTAHVGCPPATRNLLDFFEMAEIPGGKVAITFTGDELPTLDSLANGSLTPVSRLYAVIQTGGASLRPA